jgi:hypothetical protein
MSKLQRWFPPLPVSSASISSLRETATDAWRCTPAQVPSGDWTSFCRLEIYVNTRSGLGAYSKPSTGRTTCLLACLAIDHITGSDSTRPRWFLTSPAPGRGPRLPSLRLLPSHPYHLARSVCHISARWGADGHESAGLPEMSEYCAEKVFRAASDVHVGEAATVCSALHRIRGVD